MEGTLHQYLKESTRRRHEQAEGHPFQGALAQGMLPFESYKQYMAQLTELHRMFEDRLRRAAAQEPVKAVVEPQLYQLPFLQEDLAALSVQPAQAFGCIKEFDANPLFEGAPVSLLGVLYVLLGSKHGGKFIAHKVKEVYGLAEAGYTYFNPYGDSFRPLWQNFTAGLNGLPADEATSSAVLEGANAAFEIFLKIGDVIWRARESAAVSR